MKCTELTVRPRSVARMLPHPSSNMIVAKIYAIGLKRRELRKAHGLRSNRTASATITPSSHSRKLRFSRPRIFLDTEL